MPTPIENQQLKKKLLEIDEDGENLTDWETNFVADLIDKDWSVFTPKQAAIINRIHEQKVQ